MNTKFVGIKEFRQNMSKYVKGKKPARFIVVSHKKPIFEVTTFEKSESLDTLYADILEAKKDVEEGRVYTEKQVLSMLGLS